MNKRTVLRRVGMACAVVLLAAGCQSSAFRGTPYYTDKAAFETGTIEERVNLWPVAYSSGSGLSLFWPLVEKTDQYCALRPLFSAYGLKDDKRIYSALWPLAEFDQKHSDYRIFPAYWGKDYFTFFPLYWHGGEPMGEHGGYDVLFPLWWYNGNSREYDFDVIWPVFNIRNAHGETGGRVWPIAGSYTSATDAYRFFLWPLGHQWSHDRLGESGNTFLPLYLFKRDKQGYGFYSLPYVRERRGGNETDFVLPLFLRVSDGNRTEFYTIPYSFGRSQTENWDLVLPLMYRSDSTKESKFISPIYSMSTDKVSGNSWELLVPVCYSSKTGDEKNFVSLLGGWSSKGEEKCWVALPVLSGGSAGKDGGALWVLGPVFHKSWNKDGGSDHLLPLYYRSWKGDENLFVSPLGGCRTDKSGSEWLFVPLLAFGRKGAESGNVWALAPLIHADWDKQSSSHHFLPFYYWDGVNSSFYSPLYSTWQDENGARRNLILPAVTMWTKGKECSDFWTAAGLFHWSWGEKPSGRHLIPVFYYDMRSDTVISPVYASWENAAGLKIGVVPPALSWMTRGDRKTDLYGLGALVHASWGEQARAHHVFPLYYYDRTNDALVTLPYASWKWDDGSRTRAVPPALSWMTSGEKRSDLYLLGPLAHASWGEKAGANHVFPLYYSDPAGGTFASLVMVSLKDGDRRTWISPPLLSGFSKSDDASALTLLMGLGYEQWGKRGREGYFVPLYAHGRNYFYTLLAGWNNDPVNGFVYPATPIAGFWKGEYSGGWLFPLFSYSRHIPKEKYSGTFLWGQYWGSREESGSWLCPLYSYRNVHMPDESGGQAIPSGRYGSTFWSLPITWCNNQTVVYRKAVKPGEPPGIRKRSEKSNGFFPLWSYSSMLDADAETWGGTFLMGIGYYCNNEMRSVPGKTDPREYRHHRLLGLLYAYQKDFDPDARGEKPKKSESSSVLWRLWHHKTEDGLETLDLPGIAYTSKPDGFSKFSFLWRFFSYEKTRNTCKVHALFLPVWNSRSDER